jgi:hypothetical protein
MAFDRWKKRFWHYIIPRQLWKLLHIRPHWVNLNLSRKRLNCNYTIETLKHFKSLIDAPIQGGIESRGYGEVDRGVVKSFELQRFDFVYPTSDAIVSLKRRIKMKQWFLIIPWIVVGLFAAIIITVIILIVVGVIK